MSVPTSSRTDLIRDAVTFLRDPKVTSSPLTQKVQFLESKGLSSSEIERALHLASSSNSTSTLSEERQPTTQDERLGPASKVDYDHGYGPGYGDYDQGYDTTTARGGEGYGMRAGPGFGYGQGLMSRPELPRRDWRDYFIMAVVSGGVMYGLASLAQKYLLPHLQPPTRTSFEQTSSSLSEQFDAAQTLLEEIKVQTKELQDDVEGEKVRVGEAVQEVRGMVRKVGEGEERWREEMREMRQEVEELKGLVPKLIEKHASAQSSSLKELQTDLKSLRTLLQARRPLTPGPGPTGETPSSSSSSSATPQTSSTAPGPPAPSAEASALLAPRPSTAGSVSSTGANLLGSLAGGRPSIPAWQLEAEKKEKEREEKDEAGKA